jgi:four helix bundle protein
MASSFIENRQNPLHVKAMLMQLYVSALIQDLEVRHRYNLANQLDRAARSVKNNINEAQAPESREDFIHKLKVANKELNEVVGMLNEVSRFVSKNDLQIVYDLCIELSRIISRSIYTAKSNLTG